MFDAMVNFNQIAVSSRNCQVKRIRKIATSHAYLTIYDQLCLRNPFSNKIRIEVDVCLTVKNELRELDNLILFTIQNNIN